MSAPVEVDSKRLLICDTNVVILMGLFSGDAMFTSIYTFGSVEVHPSVLTELEGWLARKNAKFRKFGGPVLEQIIGYASKRVGRLKEPTESQLAKGKARLNAIETRLPPDDVGAATSGTDKELLISAYVNDANIATQERTLTEVARKSRGEDKVFSFEDMVVDLLTRAVFDAERVRSGQSSLQSMGEALRLNHPDLQVIFRTPSGPPQ